MIFHSTKTNTTDYTIPLHERIIRALTNGKFKNYGRNYTVLFDKYGDTAYRSFDFDGNYNKYVVVTEYSNQTTIGIYSETSFSDGMSFLDEIGYNGEFQLRYNREAKVYTIII